MANGADIDEAAHQDLRCLQIQLFSSLVLKELRANLGGFVLLKCFDICYWIFVKFVEF